MCICFVLLLLLYISQSANSLNPNHFPVTSTSMDNNYTFQSELERPLFTYKAGEIASNNLPHFPGPFVGRDRDVSKITNTLLSNQTMVNILGLPAVGKSTLAVHVGYEMASHGVAVRYINVDDSRIFRRNDEESTPPNSTLTEHHEPKQALAISRAFTEITLSWFSHTENRFVSATAQGLIEWAKGLSNVTLLILDNCDSLLQGKEGRNSDFIGVLYTLSKAPYLRTVTTSRPKLILLDAMSYYLKPLDNESAIELLQFVSPLLTQTDGHTINKLLDGIPLALKIVGSLVSETSQPQLIIRKLHQNLMETLTPGGVRLDTQKMRPVLELSFNYLDKDTQECALYLSHFPGSFSQEAALSILSNCTNNTSGADECLQKLIDTSLLNEYFYAGQSRYVFHRLIRDYLTDVETQISPTSMKAVRFNSSFFLHYVKTLCCDFVDTYNQLPYNEENIGRFEYESHNFEYLLEVAEVYFFSISTTTDLLYALKCDLMLAIFTTKELLKVGQRILVIVEDRMDDISTKIGPSDTLKLYFDIRVMLKKWIQSSTDCEVLCEETFPQERYATRVNIIGRQLNLANYSAYGYHYQRLSFPFMGIGESICVTYCLAEKNTTLLLFYSICTGVFTSSMTKNIKWKGFFFITGVILSGFIYWIAIVYSVSTIIYSVYIAIFLGLRHPPLKVITEHKKLGICLVVLYCTVLCVLLICAFRKTNVSVAYLFIICSICSHYLIVFMDNTTIGAHALHLSSIIFLLSVLLFT